MNCMNTRVVLRLGNGQPEYLRGSRWQIMKRMDGGGANEESKETGQRKAILNLNAKSIKWEKNLLLLYYYNSRLIYCCDNTQRGL